MYGLWLCADGLRLKSKLEKRAFMFGFSTGTAVRATSSASAELLDVAGNVAKQVETLAQKSDAFVATFAAMQRPRYFA
jgi:hypothetical protein